MVQRRKLDLVAEVLLQDGRIGEVERDGLEKIRRGEGKVSVYFPTDRGIKYQHVEEKRFLASFLELKSINPQGAA